MVTKEIASEGDIHENSGGGGCNLVLEENEAEYDDHGHSSKDNKVAAGGVDDAGRNDEDPAHRSGKTPKSAYDNSYDTEDMNEIYNKEEQFSGMMMKYWNQRYDIFKRFDGGVLLTKELWFSVTPESISKFTSKLMKHAFKDKSGPIYVMDAFAGGGGNVIQFISDFDVVFAADLNLRHLHCTKKNSEVYFSEAIVSKKLKLLPLNWVYADDSIPDTFVDEKFEETGNGSKKDERIYANKEDSLESLAVLKDIKFDCIFGSPPWGGPEYYKEKHFNLNHILPFELDKLLRILLQYTDNVCLFLPKNSNLGQLQKITASLFPDDRYIRILKTFVHERPKGLLCCWGPAFTELDLECVHM